MSEKKRPIMNFGPFPTDRNTSIESSIWCNEIEAGGKKVKTYNVTIQRSYRDGQGQWAKNQTYRVHDLPVVIHALQRAHAWILDNKESSTE
jgi:hypothetical protein